MKFANYTTFHNDIRSKGLEYAIEHTSRIGFNMVEFINFLSASKAKDIFPDGWDDVKRAKKMLSERSLGVGCYSFGATIINDENIDNTLAEFYRNIEYAAHLESPFFHHTIKMGIDFSVATRDIEDVMEEVADSVEKIAKYCNKYGIVALYEPQGCYFNGVAGIRRIFEEMKSRGCNVGICGDTGNSLFADTNPTDIYATFAPDIKHIHVKDYSLSYKPSSVNFKSKRGLFIDEVPLGTGCVNFEECFRHLDGYTGTFSFEYNASDEEFRKDMELIEALYTGKFSLEHSDEKSRKNKEFIKVLYEK